jgi:glutathione synthase/RimK-type ligase-like ATP-grasp enzyme
MNILLIGTSGTSSEPDAYYSQYKDFFDRSLKSAGDDVSTVVFTLIDDLFIAIGDSTFTLADLKSGKDLKEFDAILIRAKGLRNYFDVVKAVSTYAKLHSVAVINDYSDFRDSSKLTQAVQFFLADIPVATCVFASKGVLEEKMPLPFGFPCVMKANFGAHGNDNYLVKSIDEARGVALNNPGKNFVLQRFVPNDGDYRILVAGDETLVIRRKAVGDSHLNNTSQGGVAELVNVADLPTDVIRDARKIADILSMKIAGVDALADSNTGEFYFLEVNSQPQLMSGVFMDEKVEVIGRYLMSLTR